MKWNPFTLKMDGRFKDSLWNTFSSLFVMLFQYTYFLHGIIGLALLLFAIGFVLAAGLEGVALIGIPLPRFIKDYINWYEDFFEIAKTTLKWGLIIIAIIIVLLWIIAFLKHDFEHIFTSIIRKIVFLFAIAIAVVLIFFRPAIKDIYSNINQSISQTIDKKKESINKAKEEKRVLKNNVKRNDSLEKQMENVVLLRDCDAWDGIDSMNGIMFGEYPQNDIKGNKKDALEWVVLSNDKDNREALLLSKYIIDNKCYNNTNTACNWETSDLRNWLNSTFYQNAFTDSEKSQIILSNVISDDKSEIPYNVQDNVYCLSSKETSKLIEKYNGTYKIATSGTKYAKSISNNGGKLHVSDTARKLSPFWLREARIVGGGDYFAKIYGSSSDGGWGFDQQVDSCDCGVRPVIRVKY